MASWRDLWYWCISSSIMRSALSVAVPLHQFIDGRIDELFVATNRFINALSFEPVLARILPFSRELAELPAVHAGEVAVPYL